MAKDLGICTDSSLKFSSHIRQIVAKAHARASVIHQSQVFLDKKLKDSIESLCTVTYVRPLLKYAVCVCVWSHYQLEDNVNVKIVSVQ